jgi:hypothetical protein
MVYLFHIFFLTLSTDDLRKIYLTTDTFFSDLTDKPKKLSCGHDYMSKNCMLSYATHICTTKVILVEKMCL